MNVLSLLQSPLSIRLSSPLPAAKAVVARVMRWQDVWTQRKELLELDDRMLKDIGLTRADVAAELRKPFWRS